MFIETDVVIVGAGPAGLMLANELRLAGVAALVGERETVRSGQSTALNLQPRTAEVLDMRGLLEPLRPLTMGTIAAGHFAGLPAPLYYDGWQTRHPYQVGIAQARTEAHLEERVTELVRREHALTGLTQHADHVVAEVEGLGEITARYLVACDGGRSTVRELVSTPFDGRDAHVRAGRESVYGDAVTLVGLHYASRFTDVNRQVRHYREGRVFYARRISICPRVVRDSISGCRTRSTWAGNSPPSCVGRLATRCWTLATPNVTRLARGCRTTRARRDCRRSDGVALRETFVELMGVPQANHYLAGMISGLDIHYGEADSLVGARIPDHQLPDGSRLYERLHSADWVGVTRDEVAALEADAVLVRPDGYVYWAGDRSGLDHALATRFGAEVVNA